MFHEYPYTNFHELNTDWLIDTMKKLSSEWDEFHKQLTAEFEEFKNSMNGEWEQFESSLTQAWEKYKNDTNTALEKWKTQTTQGLETWKTQTAKKLNDSYNTFTTQVNNAISTFKNEINAKVQGQDTKITALENKVDTFIKNLDISTEVDRAFRELVNEGYVTKLLTDVKNIWAIIPVVAETCRPSTGDYHVVLSRNNISLNKKITTNAEAIITSGLQLAEKEFKGEPFNLVIFLSGEDYTQPNGQDSDYLYKLPASEHCVNTFIVPSSIYTKKDWKSSPALLLNHYKGKNFSFTFVSNALTLFSIPEQYSNKTGKWLATENVCNVLALAAINAVKYKDVKPEFIYPQEIIFTLSSTKNAFGWLVGESTTKTIRVRVVYSRKSISFRFIGFENYDERTMYTAENPSEWIVAAFNFPALNDDFIFPCTQWLTNKLASNKQLDTEYPLSIGVSGDRSLTSVMGESAGGKYLGLYGEIFGTSYVPPIAGNIWKQESITDFYLHTF